MHLRVLDLRVTMCHRLVKDIREVTGKLLCVTCTRLYHNHKFKALSFICNNDSFIHTFSEPHKNL